MLYAVGDIHGEVGKLDALLDKLPLQAGDRLVFLGDSVTMGDKIEAREALPQTLAQRFERQGRRIEVFNVALWGWSTRQERIAYERLIRPFQPDQVKRDYQPYPLPRVGAGEDGNLGCGNTSCLVTLPTSLCSGNITRGI